MVKKSKLEVGTRVQVNYKYPAAGLREANLINMEGVVTEIIERSNPYFRVKFEDDVFRSGLFLETELDVI